MKRVLQPYNLLLLLVVSSISLKTKASEDPLVKKTKTYSKSYAVGSSDKVSFENKFGTLKINLWSKNEVSVTVTITAEANTDEKAQNILDAISISDGKNSSGVYFKTIVGNSKNDKDDKKKDKWEKGEKQGFQIDYEVNMPAGNPLKANNEFGATEIGDYNGELSISNKFGKLTAGKLSNVKNVEVQFGEATIESINNGNVSVKFGSARIKGLSGSINGEFQFCDGVLINLDNNLKDLKVKNNYSELYLDLNTNISASFDIKTHFGELNNKTSFKVAEEGDKKEKDYGPKFTHEYKGKAGSGSIDIKVKSEFGEVNLGHGFPESVISEKKKKKKKVSI